MSSSVAFSAQTRAADPNDWRSCSLESVATQVTVGHVGPMAHEYVPEGIPFLRSQDIAPLRIRTGDLKYISPDFHRRLGKSALAPGDVVIVRTGRPGTAAVVPADLPVANCADLVIVRPGPELDSRFLAYYLNTAASGYVSAHLVGAVQQHFNVTSAKALTLHLPPLSEQKRIVSVLGAVDDKIDSNRQLADALERTAEAVYFARFQAFLGRKLDSAGLPEGWRVGTLADIAQLAKSTVQPSAVPEMLFEHFSIPAYDNDRTAEVVSGEAMLSGKTRLPDTDCVLLSKLNPRFQRVWWPRRERAGVPICSPEFLVLKPRPGIPHSYLYAVARWDRRFYEDFLSHVTGTTGSRQRVKPSDAMSCRAVVAPDDVLVEWDLFARPLVEQAHALAAEARHLAAVRDTLLPPLIAGHIRVPADEPERLSFDNIVA